MSANLQANAVFHCRDKDLKEQGSAAWLLSSRMRWWSHPKLRVLIPKTSTLLTSYVRAFVRKFFLCSPPYLVRLLLVLSVSLAEKGKSRAKVHCSSASVDAIWSPYISAMHMCRNTMFVLGRSEARCSSDITGCRRTKVPPAASVASEWNTSPAPKKPRDPDFVE